MSKQVRKTEYDRPADVLVGEEMIHFDDLGYATVDDTTYDILMEIPGYEDAIGVQEPLQVNAEVTPPADAPQAPADTTTTSN